MQKFEERESFEIENKGQKIFGMLHRPLSPKNKLPAVVICHGFAGSRIGKYRIYVLIAQKLAQAGIASLRFDFRGSGESEGDFSEMTIGSEVQDTLKILDFVRNDPQIDPNRIGLLGNSFGGAVATLAANKDGKVKSLALLAPLFDSSQWKAKWESFFSNPSSELVKQEMGKVLDGNVPGPGFYKEFFELNLEKDIKALQHIPLLHIHSEKDERVGIDQAEHYKNCRDDAVGITKWIRLQKSDHDFSSITERNAILDDIAKWFTETL